MKTINFTVIVYNVTLLQVAIVLALVYSAKSVWTISKLVEAGATGLHVLHLLRLLELILCKLDSNLLPAISDKINSQYYVVIFILLQNLLIKSNVLVTDLPMVIPRVPIYQCWKLESVNRVPCCSYRNYSICIPTAKD